jgi:hypothetical protein
MEGGFGQSKFKNYNSPRRRKGAKNNLIDHYLYLKPEGPFKVYNRYKDPNKINN